MLARIVFTIAILAATLAAPCALAQPSDQVPTAKSPAEVPPGKTGLLTSSSGMKYFLRVPASYDAKRGTRVIVFMHGSNMNGLTYLRSFEGAGWAKDDILVCPNGEMGGAAADPYGSNNFGFGSAKPVAEVTREVLEHYRATRVYVGGHSQGGYVTYSVILHYPDLYHGAIPMAGDCWSQNEPNLWETKPETMAKQKEIAIAVIHGKADPVVSFEQGQHAYDVFRAMGYPKLRLYAPERLGHQFLLSPVPDALAWLDAMTGLSPEVSLQKVEEWAKAEEWGWVGQTARAILEEKKMPKAAKSAAKKLLKAVEAKAKPATKAMAERMAKQPAQEWIEPWLEYWRIYGATDAARPLVQQYLKQRSEQRNHAERLFGEARSAFQNQQSDAAYVKLEELLEKAPATYHAYYAWSWLSKR